jgi:hypothetical protein
MKNENSLPELALLGGPLHRLGRLLGLVRGQNNTIPLGLALSLLAWGVLMLLGIVEGFGAKAFSLKVLGLHVRLLVAIPLLFICESLAVHRMAGFAVYLVRSGLVPHASLQGLSSAVRVTNRLADSWLAELLLLLVALSAPLSDAVAPVAGGTGSYAAMLDSALGSTWVGAWYLWFCLPLFRFLLFRWLWRLFIWYHFLWRVQELHLRLLATHSVHEEFAPLAAATSAIYAAQFAEAIASGTMIFERLYSLVPMVILLAAVLFVLPLLLFFKKLYLCRWSGISDYMTMASHYVDAFDRKWIGTSRPPAEELLGTPDLQSLADLTNSLNVIQKMKLAPVSQRLLLLLAVYVVLPLLPLLLFKFPATQLAAWLFQMIAGI